MHKTHMLVKWTLVGNKCLWDFFEFHKGHRLHIMIKKLLHAWQIIREGHSLVCSILLQQFLFKQFNNGI